MTFPVVGSVPSSGPQQCEFALCRSEADYVVSLPHQEPIRVCSVHQTPVVLWGWTGEDDFPVIVRLAS